MFEFLSQLDPTALALLVGAVLPLLTSLVQQPKWSKQTRQYVAFGISIVVGLATALASQPDGPLNFLLVAVAVIAAAEATYEKLWQPTGAAPALEALTSPTSEKAGRATWE